MKNKIWNGFLGFCLVIGLWQVGSSMLQRPFFPTPIISFAAFFQFFFFEGMWQDFLISAFRIVASLWIAFFLAVPFGIAMGRIQWLGKICNPIVYLLYPLPKVVFLPIIVVLMGLGNGPKIFLITLVVFFQVVVVARDAASQILEEHIQSMQSLNANSWQMFWHLIFPSCMPQILTSLRITLGTAIAILFFAETFASFDGLGYFILDGMEMRNYPAMYAGILGLALLGFLLYIFVDFIEQKICKWK